jgi:lambda family phage minor tail protein L
MSNHPLAADVHAGSLGQEIELFMVDYTMLYNRRTGLPGSVIYFCSSANNATAVQWKNKAGDALVAYAPLPVVAEGFESKSDGTLPRPKISVSNVEATLGVMAGPLFSLVYDYHDLLGAKLTRYKTLGKYLGNINNINAHFPKDVYVFHQKTAQNALMIEWELAPDFDAQGVMLPRRLVLRDQCQLRYRRWDAVNSVFIYDGTENGMDPLR